MFKIAKTYSFKYTDNLIKWAKQIADATSANYCCLLLD